MAYASRRLNFDVYMTDINPLALEKDENPNLSKKIQGLG